MEIKEAFIDEVICHHFSVDSSRCIINNTPMGLSELDVNMLKDFFIKPFAGIKTEFVFSHPVDLSFNVIYQIALKVLNNGDFISCSRDIFKHLQSVSTLPTIKDGDVFITKVSDIMIGDSYYDGLGIFKIERKSEFIETYQDEGGRMQFAIKNGFSSNRIDKACLIVFTERMPKCYLIDISNDTKFWKQDFLGVVIKPNAYSQSKAAIEVFKSFVSDELKERVDLTREEEVSLLNRWTEEMKKADRVEVKQVMDQVINDKDIRDAFTEYCNAYEEREGVRINDGFDVDKNAVSLPKKLRTIKLDDTVEINLIKTGPFIERGFDKKQGRYYYKFYFSRER